jgi:hypothetical protein
MISRRKDPPQTSGGYHQEAAPHRLFRHRQYLMMKSPVVKNALRGYHVVMLPPLYICRLCQGEIIIGGSDVFHRVCGWSEAKPGAVTQTVTLAEQMYLYAHGACVRVAKAGGKVESQDSLF